jgi:hypothetical protein
LQLATSVTGSMQLLPQRVGMDGGQFEPQTDVEHTGVPPLHAWPHVPQLAPSLIVLTQAPAQSVYPALHVKLHTLAMQVGRAFAMVVEQALPHEAQLLGSTDVSTQVFPHWVAALVGQIEAQAYVPRSGAHTGVSALHTLPHAPQLEALAGSTQPPSHASDPSGQLPCASFPASSPPSPCEVSVPLPASFGPWPSSDALASQSPEQWTDW